MTILRPLLIAALLALPAGFAPTAAHAVPATYDVCALGFLSRDHSDGLPTGGSLNVDARDTFAADFGSGAGYGRCEANGLFGTLTYDEDTNTITDVAVRYPLVELNGDDIGFAVPTIGALDPAYGSGGVSMSVTDLSGTVYAWELFVMPRDFTTDLPCQPAGTIGFCIVADFGEFTATLLDELDGSSVYERVTLFGTITRAVAPVPLPAGGLLLIAGLGALTVARRRRDGSAS